MYYISWHMAMWMPKLAKMCQGLGTGHIFTMIVYTPSSWFASLKILFCEKNGRYFFEFLKENVKNVTYVKSPAEKRLLRGKSPRKSPGKTLARRGTSRGKRKSHQLKADGFWQRVKDSNPHIQSQSLLCYHYTNPLFRCRSYRTMAIIANRKKKSIPFLHFFEKIFEPQKRDPFYI